MNRKLVAVISCLAVGLVSCGIRTIKLGNKVSRIPKNKGVYRNLIKFDTSACKIIDTSVVYEAFNSTNKVLNRLDNNDIHRVYGIYRFYSNGFMNYFVISKDEKLTPKEFDPGYNGYRGIYYIEGNRISGELFTAINGLGHIGKVKKEFTVSGDTLIVSRGKSDLYPQVYIKRKLPSEYIAYKISN